MTVKFNVVERGNPGNPQAPKKFYPSVQSSGRMTLRELTRQISAISLAPAPTFAQVVDEIFTGRG